ncbi:restriction endonuclease subunit S [Vibrio sp. 10N.222.51.C8]
MIKQMPKYEAYKDSGNDWFSSIPAHWEIKKLSHVFQNIGSGTTPPTSISSNYIPEVNWLQTGDLNDGIIVETSKKISCSAYKNHSTLKLYPPGSLVIAMYGATIGKLGLLNIETTTNQACCVLSGSRTVLPKYFFYCFLGFRKEIISLGYGGGQPNISQEVIRSLRLPFPTIDEQERICIYLDSCSKKIDEAIVIKQKQIELLKERKQIIIQQAVTEGLNPNVSMKDSGVDWIGTIPEHWSVKRAKYLLDEINERSETGFEELLSVSHMTGVTPRSEKNVTMFMAEDYTGSKLCHSGDLVINIMWAWMGALGVSDRTGIVSPSYGVFREQREGTFVPKYLEMLLKSTKYVEYYNKVSTGLHSSRLRFYGHMLFDMALGFPPYEEQTQIVESISRECAKVDEAITVQVEQVSKLKEYKTTLINSAVTGKIKVTELA